MDPTRWNTGEVLAAGVLGRQVPTYGRPEGREEQGWDAWEGTDEQVSGAIEAGKIVECSEYYGIPIAWKTDDGAYRGVLLQYRNVTEDRQFSTINDVVDWFTDTARSVRG